MNTKIIAGMTSAFIIFGVMATPVSAVDFIEGTSNSFEENYYSWNSTDGIFQVLGKLENVTFEERTKKVTIENTKEGNTINNLEFQTADKLELTFSGDDKLVVDERIKINSAAEIKISEEADVQLNNGIETGTSGGEQANIQIEGNLTAKDHHAYDDIYDPAVYTKNVTIETNGSLTVSGNAGVKVINSTDGEKAFEVKGDGEFSANCTDYNLMTIYNNIGTFEDAEKMLAIPESDAYEIVEVLDGTVLGTTLKSTENTDTPVMEAEYVTNSGGEIYIGTKEEIVTPVVLAEEQEKQTAPTEPEQQNENISEKYIPDLSAGEGLVEVEESL